MAGQDSSKTDLSYKGKKVTLDQSGDKATTTIDGAKFNARRQAGMWIADGVHNPYRDLGALSRHIVDYLHLVKGR